MEKNTAAAEAEIVLLTFRVTRDRCYEFLNIIAKKMAKILAFLTQIKAKLCKNLIITLVFEKKRQFFAENCQKSQKIVIIITSTPGHTARIPVSPFSIFVFPVFVERKLNQRMHSSLPPSPKIWKRFYRRTNIFYWGT
jgi:hypothetical protein